MSEVPPSAPGVVRFGNFELDARSGELRKAGVRVSVQDQPLQVLEVLLERPGELITRDELRQRLWPSDTFVDFDHGLNAAVGRLRESLGDSADTPRFIETLPRRGYRFIAPVDGHRLIDPSGSNEAAAQVDVQPKDIPPARRAGIAALSAGVLIVAGIVAWRLRPAPDVEASPRVVPLTTFKGWEGHPSFSPDGTQIAFTWSGGKDGDAPWDGRDGDTYVQIIGFPEVRRLTTSHPAGNWNPQWSPDGRYIGFVHCDMDTGTGCRLYVTSPLGGSDRKVSDLSFLCSQIAWSPDSHFIAAARWSKRDSNENGIYLVPSQGGAPRAITRAPAGALHASPAFSPDGHRLAYVSCVIDGGCDVFSVDVDASFTPIGVSRRLTTETVLGIKQLAWTRDGRSLLYDSQAVPYVSYIWRLSTDGTRPPERVELAGFGSWVPATVPSQDWLAFQRSWYNVDVYQATAGHLPRPLVTSSFQDFNPQFSPDGRHIVFCSSRSGEALEIWVAAADGSGEHRLLQGPNRLQGAPHWSPDGRSIAFESLGSDGHWHVWIVDAEGGQPHQLVVDAGDQGVPMWSHDGRRIYFWSEQNIWRVPVAGGRREQLTQGGTWPFASESADGKSLLYQSSQGKGGALMIEPLSGGQARQVLPCVRNSAFIAGAKGIYYVPCDAGPDPPVNLLDPVSGRSRALMTLDKLDQNTPLGLAVSPDGNSVLYVRFVAETDDLMLIENFR